MRLILGIDTSNYTTSVALADAQSGQVLAQCKRLLPVKPGERGLRQSDAVFHHTAALPQLLEQLFSRVHGEVVAVAVSEKPAEQEGSYMPCFLAGVSAAGAVAAALGVPLYRTSHQKGHVLACLYGCGEPEALEREFLCFHVSGGTTDALVVSPDAENIVHIERVAGSLDLKAGQAVDRIGVKMGLRFPAGKELDALAQKSDKRYKNKAKLIGNDCSLSGLENLAANMLERGESREDTARFCFDYIANTLKQMSQNILGEKTLAVYFAGGVMSNSIISHRLHEEIGAHFCPPEFSADNAAGIAVYGYLQCRNLKN